MFTGIIRHTGIISSVTPLNGGREMVIDCDFADKLKIDESISINGVCHTVVSRDANSFTVQSVEETLRKTNTGDLSEGDPVNLERSVRVSQMLDGHIVQGHVDTTGVLESMEKEGTDRLFTISYPGDYSNLVVGRGSIAVEGISLTVAREQGNEFTVAVIPYTFDHTNLRSKKEGDRLNLEFDIIGKYVAKAMGKGEYLSGDGE